jgi:hypothetical protein
LCHKNASRSLIWFKALVTCWITIQITGCGSHQTYQGQDTPSSEMAILHLSSDFTTWIDNPGIFKLDGEFPMDTNVVKAEIKPGDHTMQLRCVRRFSSIFTPIPHSGTIKFSVEAGHEYKVYCDVTKHKVFYWIEESTTGDIAGGEKP